MFKFFDWVIDTVAALISFVVQTITGTIQLIGLIPTAVNSLTNAIGYLPSFFAAFAGATITISVIFMIVGRQSGGQK